MNRTAQIVSAVSIALINLSATAPAAAQDSAGTSAVDDDLRLESEAAETGQSGDGAEPAKRKSASRMVEEIVVMAQKREENISDVPISIQAFSPEALEARGVTSTSDLMKITPALDYGTQAGDFTSVFIRGIGSEAWLTSDPSVATYIDGVYYPFSPSVAQDLGGVERVEILKGPQGTLFGRNANGGAINVIIKEPHFEDRSVTFSQYYDSYEKSRTQFFANVPLTDTLAMNTSAYFTTDPTYWTDNSTIAGHDIPNNKTAAARVKLRWLPTDSLDLRMTIQGVKRDGTATLAAPIAPTLLGQLSGIDPEDGRNRYVHPDLPIYGHLQSFVTSGQGNYTGSFFDTKLLLSHQVHSNPYNYDYDGWNFPGASFIVHRHYAYIDEAELQLLSNEGTPFSDWLTVTAGAFFFKNQQGFDPVEVTVGGINPDNLGALTADQLDFLDNLLEPVQQLLEPITGPLSDATFPTYALSNIGLLGTESWSVYLQMTANLTDRLSLTLGGRYQNEYRHIIESNTSLRVSNFLDPVVFNWDYARDGDNNPVPTENTTKGFKPKVALDYRFDDGTLLYASYQEAVKAHTYNAFAFYLRPAYIPEEEMTAYEVGLKTILFEGTTTFTTAVWRYDLTNLQTQAISLLNGGALSISTAGNARSQGIEFDMTSELFPSLFSGLVLTLNGAYIDAIYTKYEDGQGHQNGTGIFLASGQDYTGNRITRTPDYTASAALSKTWDITGGPLEATVSTYYNSGFNYEASENPDYEQPAYQTVGAHLSYLWEAYNLRATLSGDNLTDEFYTAGILLLDWTSMATIGQPRTIGFRLDWTF